MGIINLWHQLALYRLYKKARKHPELLKDVKFLTEVFKTAWEIKEIREMLKGFKSYIVAAVAAAVTVAHMLGYIDEAMFQSLMALLGAGAVTTVAAKLNRATNERRENFNDLMKK
jgi:hypothetical protein